jgi:hypothetical protein
MARERVRIISRAWNFQVRKSYSDKRMAIAVDGVAISALTPSA